MPTIKTGAFKVFAHTHYPFENAVKKVWPLALSLERPKEKKTRSEFPQSPRAAQIASQKERRLLQRFFSFREEGDERKPLSGI